MSTLPNWPIFVNVPSYLLRSVIGVLVYGKTGDEILVFVQESDDAIGLYITRLHEKLSTKLATLKGQKIKIVNAVVSASQTFLVLTDTKLYSWGTNTLGQVGNGQTCENVQYPFPVSETDKLKEQSIVKMAVGQSHTVCLTSTGRVFAWGGNQYGQVGGPIGTHSLTPFAIEHDIIKYRRIVSICCSAWATFALDSDGYLFGWGYNDGSYPMLGRAGGSSNVPVPIASDTVLKDVILKEIACGAGHVLALTASGTVFSWGGNAVGQRGSGNTAIPWGPGEITAFNNPRVRIESILASNMKSISVARAINGQVYIWGETRFSSPMPTPTPVPGNSTQRAFFDWIINPLITPGLVKVENMQLLGEPTQVPLWLRQSFDNATTADVKFSVEGRTINAHRSILISRSAYFSTMFANDAIWSEAKSGLVEITHYSYDVYRALLYFLYTNEIDVADEGMQKEDLVSLHGLAKCYFEEEMKNKVCDVIIRKYLNLDSVLSLYALAVDNDIKGVAAACMELILENLPPLIKSPAFDELNPVHAKEIFKMCATRNLFRDSHLYLNSPGVKVP